MKGIIYQKVTFLVCFVVFIVACSKDSDQDETACWTFTYTRDCKEDLLDDTYETTQCNLSESLAEGVRKSSEGGTTYEGVSCTLKVTKRKS